MPLAYLFAEDERQVRLLLAFAALSKAQQDALLVKLEAETSGGHADPLALWAPA